MIEVSLKTKIISTLLVAFVIGGLLRVFVIEAFIVRGDSMEPTIMSGEYVFVNKLAYLNKNPKREDIIVVIPRGIRVKLLKRVIGMPDEYFEINEGKVLVRENRTSTSTALTEVYLPSGMTTESAREIFTNIDPKEYFVMGDNRETSIDSRTLDFVDRWDIKGKVIGSFNFSSFSYKGF